MSGVVILANPAASGFSGMKLRVALAVLGPETIVHWPEDREATASLAAAAGATGATVVAMGGDGMVHHVARGVIGTPGRLGIIPVGTTNVLARIAGIPSDVEDAAATIADGDTARLPTATASWDGDGTVTRPVLFSLSVGWDAAVVAKAEATPYDKSRGGLWLYARTAFGQLHRELGRIPDLIIDGDPILAGAAIALQVQVHHVYTFAGPVEMRLGPAVEGRLLAGTWRRMRAGAIPSIAWASRTPEGVGSHADIDVAAVEAVGCSAAHPVPIQIDGEPLGTCRRLRVGVGPSIPVMVPAGR